VGERIGAAEGGRQTAPKAEKKPFWGSAPPPGIFCRWGHVTGPQNIFGWVLRPLCVDMAYGFRMSRLGAPEECYIAHNVHLCPDLAKKPNYVVFESDELCHPADLDQFKPAFLSFLRKIKHRTFFQTPIRDRF